MARASWATRLLFGSDMVCDCINDVVLITKTKSIFVREMRHHDDANSERRKHEVVVASAMVAKKRCGNGYIKSIFAVGFLPEVTFKKVEAPLKRELV